MGDCKCLDAKVTISNDIHAKVVCSDQPSAAVSVGPVTIRDGTNDYNQLVNQPSINEVVLQGNKTFEDLGDKPLSNIEIKQMFDRIFGQGD